MKKIILRNTEISIKLFLITLFVIITIVVNNNYLYQPYHKNIQYGEEQGISILGGSNVMYGISAKLLMRGRKNYKIKNYSIPNEGRIFSMYIKWVSSYLKYSPVIIYSSIDFWTLGQKSGADIDVEKQHLPYRPLLIDLYNYVKSKLFLSQKQFRRKFDSFGDLKKDNFKCNKEVKVFNIEKLKGGLSKSKVSRFISRFKIIKSTFNSAKVILRVPPLYINKKDQAIFEKYIKDIHDTLKKNKIEVLIPNPVLYFDNKFVCNAAHHPKSELRAILTKDLLKQLIMNNNLPKND